jgi:hypothetical protein
VVGERRLDRTSEGGARWKAVQSFETGMVKTRYDADGMVETGSFGTEWLFSVLLSNSSLLSLLLNASLGSVGRLAPQCLRSLPRDAQETPRHFSFFIFDHLVLSSLVVKILSWNLFRGLSDARSLMDQSRLWFCRCHARVHSSTARRWQGISLSKWQHLLVGKYC